MRAKLTIAFARLVLLLPVALNACAPEEASAPDDVGRRAEPILGGTTTCALPEVVAIQVPSQLSGAPGVMGCTGTLVAHNVVLTAGHCYAASPKGSGVIPAHGALFNHNCSSQQQAAYAIDKWKAYTIDDFALVRLAGSVPSSLATPRALATLPPANGALVTQYGYGCDNELTQTGGGIKRQKSFNWGAAVNISCPGDSGGPIIDFFSGKIVSTSSFRGVFQDFNTNVPVHAAKLKKTIDRWSGLIPLPVPPDDDEF